MVMALRTFDFQAVFVLSDGFRGYFLGYLEGVSNFSWGVLLAKATSKVSKFLCIVS